MRSYSSLLLIVLPLLISPIVQAQISGELRSASDNNSSCGSSSDDRSSGSSNSQDDSYSSDTDYSSDSQSDYSGYSGDGGSASLPPFPFVNLQKRSLARRTDLKRIISLEVNSPLGLNLDGYLTFSPEIKANWGIFTGSFRHFNIVEPGIEGPDGWRTFDIDFFQLNLINRKNIRLRAGTGITVEDYKNKPFHEYLAGLDLFLFKDNLLLSGEKRVSTNYCGCPFQRSEWNAGVNFMILDKPHFRIYNSYNYMNQLYYGSARVWSVGGGLRFIIIR